MTIYLDTYEEFIDWCSANNYSEEEYERESEKHKRDEVVYAFIKKNDEELYASVCYTQSYDYGSENFEIEEGFTRKEEQVTITKVSFVKQ